MIVKISDLLRKTAPALIFALLSGLAYFELLYVLLDDWIVGENRLILFFFSPVIVCGAAIVIIKLIKKQHEFGNDFNVAAIFFAHVLLMIIAAATFVASLIS